jgi:PAS domain-containing protein
LPSPPSGRSNAHERELALQYRDLAAGIYRQRRLLESITNAMREMLCLKTAAGRYAYVNPAFADAFGKPVDDIVGRTDVELFGSDVAADQAASDRRALDGGPVAAETSQLELGGRTRHLSTSKVCIVPLHTTPSRNLLLCLRYSAGPCPAVPADTSGCYRVG